MRCVQRYMIASLRLRMTDPKPSELCDSGATCASSSLSVSDTSNYKFWPSGYVGAY